MRSIDGIIVSRAKIRSVKEILRVSLIINRCRVCKYIPLKRLPHKISRRTKFSRALAVPKLNSSKFARSPILSGIILSAKFSSKGNSASYLRQKICGGEVHDY